MWSQARECWWPPEARRNKEQILPCRGPWWTDPREAPDWATHIDIHNKPGYDPSELFFGGFFPPRTCQDHTRIKGTHGRACETAWASTASVSLESPKNLARLFEEG